MLMRVPPVTGPSVGVIAVTVGGDEDVGIGVGTIEGATDGVAEGLKVLFDMKVNKVAGALEMVDLVTVTVAGPVLVDEAIVQFKDVGESPVTGVHDTDEVLPAKVTERTPVEVP